MIFPRVRTCREGHPFILEVYSGIVWTCVLQSRGEFAMGAIAEASARSLPCLNWRRSPIHSSVWIYAVWSTVDPRFCFVVDEITNFFDSSSAREGGQLC